MIEDQEIAVRLDSHTLGSTEMGIKAAFGGARRAVDLTRRGCAAPRAHQAAGRVELLDTRSVPAIDDGRDRRARRATTQTRGIRRQLRDIGVAEQFDEFDGVGATGATADTSTRFARA